MNLKRKSLLLLAAGWFAWWNAMAQAEEPKLTLSPEPLRYGYVHGDVGKFSEHHWMKDRYAGGIKDFSFDYDDAERGLVVESEGHAIIDENDIEGMLKVTQKDKGYFKVDYKGFRKYYDGSGGTYYPFGRLQMLDLDRELRMDMGEFELEAGLTLPEWPLLTLTYARETKKGVKSRLSWASVLVGGVTRKISPSWQEVDEVVHDVEIKAEKEDVLGFHLKGEQKWEFVRTETSRYEQQFSDTTTASNNKIRKQDQEPIADYNSTTVELDRWLFGEKAFFSTGYRHAHITAKEIEDIYETNAAGVPQSYANAENVRNALAYTKFDTHTWVGSAMANPWQWLEAIGRFKTEVYRAKGSSNYPKDSTPTTPDGIINTTELSGTANKILRIGEGLSLRFKGIPKTALYTDLEFEQTKDYLIEDRTSKGGQSAPNANEIFSRVTAEYVRRGVGKIGARTSPWRFMDITTEVRHWQNNNDYDDRRETDPAGTAARSAFTDWQNISTNEVMTRLTLRPARWIQPSFRYQSRADRYDSMFEGNGVDVTHTRSNIYTFDCSVQPMPDLLATMGVSKQDAWTKTPAALAATNLGQIPVFYSNVISWLFSTEYSINEKTTLINSITASQADNYRDFTSFGLPLGASYGQLDVVTSLRWSPTADLTIEPRYGYYRYAPNEAFEYAQGYGAHVVWLDLTLEWPFLKEAGKKIGDAGQNLASKYL